MNVKYPIGIQNFESLRKDGYFYVDKTALMYELVQNGRYYFLSRPRRFGKSLLISTLEAYFQGKRELFEGLAVEKLETDWVKRPVLHIDLNTEKYEDPESLEKILNDTLSKWETVYGTEPSEASLPLRFKGIIRRAREQTGHRVAILVDEYDKPMLQAIGNEELQKSFRSILQAFYSVIKTMDGSIKFTLMTGATQLGKMSVPNNFMDISMDEQYAELCGITEQELRDNFNEDINQLAQAEDLTNNEVYAKLKEYYGGYHFEENSVGIYNPFSLLNTFNQMQFGNYWFEIGLPTYLMELLKQYHYDLHRIENVETDADALVNIDYSSINPIPLIYQNGYLSIKDYDRRFCLYRLGFPNREVEEGFKKFYQNKDQQ